jgi:hypothetical protein
VAHGNPVLEIDLDVIYTNIANLEVIVHPSGERLLLESYPRLTKIGAVTVKHVASPEERVGRREASPPPF